MSSPAIKAINLTKKYGSLLAVDHINFEVAVGEIFGLLGPNGAGKSTTIGMLTTLVKPTEGTALVNGFDVIRQSSKVRASIGVVLQEYTADEDLTGWENLMLAASLYGIPNDVAKERAKELLEMVELANAANKKVENYSGGMRRRLEIAMGLINRPRILFLDEPTLGLDVQTRSAIWTYITKLKREYNMTILVTTHYLEEADAYCDRIAIIDRGRIAKIGTPKELKESLGGDIIMLQIVGNVDLAKQVIMSIDGMGDVRIMDNSIWITAKDGGSMAPQILEALNKNGVRVAKISITEPTMDEVYMKYTGKSLREEQSNWEEAMSTMRTIRKARS